MTRHVAQLAWAVLLVTLGTGGCQGKKAKEEPAPTGLAGQLANTVSDQQVMREAVDAANKVIRNATDCEAANFEVEGARAKIAEALQKVKTPTGRASLQALLTQVDNVANNCM